MEGQRKTVESYGRQEEKVLLVLQEENPTQTQEEEAHW